MQIKIDYQHAGAYADHPERGDVAIACTSLWDGLAHFFETHRWARELEIEQVWVR